MITIETSVIIAAPPPAVRETFLDFTSYPQWNPFITSFESPFPSPPPGTRVKLVIVGRRVEPVILENTPQTFNWKGIFLGEWFFAGHHFFNFEPHGDGEEAGMCKLVQFERFTGIGVSLLMLFIKKQTEKGFNDLNSALKARVEASYSGDM
jgi:hypothetical protein